MRLLRLTPSLLVVFALACHDTVEPTPTVSRLYTLETVDGQPLPATISAGAGETTQVVWSTLTLESSGQAVTVHHLSGVWLQNPPEESTVVRRQEYRITGDSIEIGSFHPCPPGAECVGNNLGQIGDSTVAIAEFYRVYPTDPVVYRYRLVQIY